MHDKSLDEKLDIVHNFFKDKYKKSNVDLTNLDVYMCNMPKVPEDLIDLLNDEIKISEILAAINNLPNRKSPGSDGLTHFI